MKALSKFKLKSEIEERKKGRLTIQDCNIQDWSSMSPMVYH